MSQFVDIDLMDLDATYKAEGPDKEAHKAELAVRASDHAGRPRPRAFRHE
jgi:hypothetical protein